MARANPKERPRSETNTQSLPIKPDETRSIKLALVKKQPEPDAPYMLDIHAEQRAFFKDCEAATATKHIPTQMKLLSQAILRVDKYYGYTDRDWQLETETVRALLQGVHPRDTVEAQLAVQLVISHEIAARCAADAFDPSNTPEVKFMLLRQTERFMAVHAKQVAALANYRAKRPPIIEGELIDGDRRESPAPDRMLEAPETEATESNPDPVSDDVPHHMLRSELHRLEAGYKIEDYSADNVHIPEYAHGVDDEQS